MPSWPGPRIFSESNSFFAAAAAAVFALVTAPLALARAETAGAFTVETADANADAWAGTGERSWRERVRGEVKAVQVLLRAKANPDVHGNYDTFDTPLIIAAKRGYFPIVRALVAAGANVGLYGGQAGRTAECIARHEGHHEISEYLCCNEKKPAA